LTFPYKCFFFLNIFFAVALPPEKTDGVCSGDEKKAEKESDTRTGSKKQLKFEVSFLYSKVSLQ